MKQFLSISIIAIALAISATTVVAERVQVGEGSVYTFAGEGPISISCQAPDGCHAWIDVRGSQVRMGALVESTKIRINGKLGSIDLLTHLEGKIVSIIGQSKWVFGSESTTITCLSVDVDVKDAKNLVVMRGFEGVGTLREAGCISGRCIYAFLDETFPGDLYRLGDVVPSTTIRVNGKRATPAEFRALIRAKVAITGERREEYDDLDAPPLRTTCVTLDIRKR